jgi:hypothetical protein
MFCPKCGVQNPEEGIYCRSCGTDLGNVSAALTGKLPVNDRHSPRGITRRGRGFRSPGETFAAGIREVIVGAGFLIAAILLLITNAANGHTWWWALLIPGFGALARGISNVIAYNMNKGGQNVLAQGQASLNQVNRAPGLPPTQTEYVSPDSRYKTGDLVPPSVTDSTTRHLEMDSEGKTMTLPKK